MENHLTEQELIEYQFKLASDIQSKQTAEHLQSCEQCHGHLEKLQRKFAALNLLKGDVKVSEDLISQVVEQAKRPAKAKILLFRKPAWISTVAAIILFGSLILVTQIDNKNRKQAQAPENSAPVATDTTAPGGRQVTTPEIFSSTGENKNIEKTFSAAKGLGENGSELVASGPPSGTGFQPVAGIPGAKDDVLELKNMARMAMPQPPFAPASAIELVTLPRRDSVQLTIYNSADLTLVREKRNLTLKKGWNWLQFMWANTLIDPTSLSLEPQSQADKIEIQQLVFPARLREIGRWLIHSEISGQVPFEITYFTSGLSWRAFYMGTLSRDEKTMRLDGYVRVANNSGEGYENAQTRLIVGQVHQLDEIAELARRQYPYGSPFFKIPQGKGFDRSDAIMYDVPTDGLGVSDLRVLEDLELKLKEIVKEGLSEYFLYTIEGTETIPNEWGKRLLSFEAEDVNVVSLYKYDKERWGDETIRYVSFANDKEHNLGETPIPNGDVRIYGRADGEGHLSYVGGSEIKYIPVGEEIELNLGPARLVEVEPKLMEFRTENFVYDPNGNMNGWDEVRTWQVDVTNTRTLAVEIEITRGFDTNYWTMQADTAYEKHDAAHARFELAIEPRSKRSFNYTIRTYHGVREQISIR